MKLLANDGANKGSVRHHGYLTVEACARPEITAPEQARLFAMAVTSLDNRDRGRPSSWSAAIDRLASDADTDGEAPRLFIVSAGNVKDPNAWAQYPASNTTDGIHDPAQSWNALTVGAATELVDITEPDTEQYRPIALEGGLSPFSTTSVTWQPQWPETIRALVVHSAEWTSAMRQTFLPANRNPNKTQMEYLVRHCGFGMPDIDRAMWSAENSLTMICEARLNPFKRDGSKQPTLRDMHLHQLPWPLQELEALGNTPVEMRVTLSYFIEPNPSERGFSARYCYESHGLRFDVKRATESEQNFRLRINAAARNEDDAAPTGGSDNAWLIGKSNRHKGSLHCDIWKGTAADLASRGFLVFTQLPVGGRHDISSNVMV